jgi:hypothetical protein
MKGVTKMETTIDILGTVYRIESSEEISTDLATKSLDGETNFIDKVIKIKYPLDMLPGDDCTNHKHTYYNQVLRHELVHAFFYEAGLTDYAYNETIVEFIASQFPKLSSLFKNEEVEK